MDDVGYYRGKRILVTGAAGSIGSQLVRQLITLSPATIRVLDNNETGLFELENDLGTDAVRLLIGDVRDRDRLLMAMDGIDIVFHASALKHVPLCEYNPFDAVKTNVLGTQNVLDAALEAEVGKVINVSTDKAVKPANVMGATKLLAERLTISANYYSGSKKTVFSNIRFGNVLNSRGSVIPLFMKQIREGGPVTVTDGEMVRYCMHIPDAVRLILMAGILARGREIFILKMPVVRIIDLARVMIDELAPRSGQKPGNIQVKIIGKREGEKLYEELMTEEESERAFENEEMYIIHPPAYSFETYEFKAPAGFSPVEHPIYSSRDVKPISRGEVATLFRKMEKG
jgi:UDP-N-acetylglucosamine 4,6-dehydratase/5-epimerase